MSVLLRGQKGPEGHRRETGAKDVIEPFPGRGETSLDDGRTRRAVGSAVLEVRNCVRVPPRLPPRPLEGHVPAETWGWRVQAECASVTSQGDKGTEGFCVAQPATPRAMPVGGLCAKGCHGRLGIRVGSWPMGSPYRVANMPS